MLAKLRALFGVVVDIVLLRRGPEHLPASPTLLALTMGAFVLVAGAVSSLLSTGDPKWPLELAVVTIMTPLWYLAALQLVNKRERFLQTVTALFAVLLLFAPIALPIASSYMAQAQAFEQTQVPPSALLGLLLLFLVVWRFAICVRIVRAAFEWSIFPAVMLVLAQEFVMLLVLAALIGPAPTP
jgi:hypothetical protein